MLPTENIFVYFYLLLGGFMTVWTFRKTAGFREKLGQFEYAGFSAFWGIVIMMFVSMLTNIKTPPADVINGFGNPLVTGFLTSLIGMAFAHMVGRFFRRIKK